MMIVAAIMFVVLFSKGQLFVVLGVLVIVFKILTVYTLTVLNL
jgi:hypothetical protein